MNAALQPQGLLSAHSPPLSHWPSGDSVPSRTLPSAVWGPLLVCSQHSFRDIPCLRFSSSVFFFFIISMSAKFLPSDLTQHLPFRHKTQGTRPVMPTHADSFPMPMPALRLCNSHHYLSVCPSAYFLLNFSFLLCVLVGCHTEPKVITSPSNGLPFLPLLVWDLTLSHWQSFKDLLGHWAVNQGQCGTWEHKPEAFATVHGSCSPSY